VALLLGLGHGALQPLPRLGQLPFRRPHGRRGRLHVRGEPRLDAVGQLLQLPVGEPVQISHTHTSSVVQGDLLSQTGLPLPPSPSLAPRATPRPTPPTDLCTPPAPEHASTTWAPKRRRCVGS